MNNKDRKAIKHAVKVWNLSERMIDEIVKQPQYAHILCACDKIKDIKIFRLLVVTKHTDLTLHTTKSGTNIDDIITMAQITKNIYDRDIKILQDDVDTKPTIH